MCRFGFCIKMTACKLNVGADIGKDIRIAFGIQPNDDYYCNYCDAMSLSFV